MSAVPDNIGPFGSWDTLTPELGSGTLSNGQASNVVNAPRSDGVSWTGVLNNVSATADSLLNLWGKAVSFTDAAEDKAYQRELKKATFEVNKAQAFGSLEVQKATVDANKQIALAQAQRAVSDQLARTNSGAAGYVTVPDQMPTKWLVIAGIVGIAAYLKWGKK